MTMLMAFLGVGAYVLAKHLSASAAVRNVDKLLTAPTVRTPAKMRRRLARLRVMLKRSKREARVVEIANATVREAKGLAAPALPREEAVGAHEG